LALLARKRSSTSRMSEWIVECGEASLLESERRRDKRMYKREVKGRERRLTTSCETWVFLALEAVLTGKSSAWIEGRTPPCEMVTPPTASATIEQRWQGERNRTRWPRVSATANSRSLFNSSSFLMANCKCRGMIRDFLLSRAALPANSRISAERYSRTAAR
jgi:hypothetical protein